MYPCNYTTHGGGGGECPHRQPLQVHHCFKRGSALEHYSIFDENLKKSGGRDGLHGPLAPLVVVRTCTLIRIVLFSRNQAESVFGQTAGVELGRSRFHGRGSQGRGRNDGSGGNRRFKTRAFHPKRP